MRMVLSTLALLLLVSSCRKSGDLTVPPGNPNNEVKASVTMPSGVTTVEITNGNATLFAWNIYPNGDTMITVQGGSTGSMKLTLINFKDAGSYGYGYNVDSTRYLSCTFTIGNILTGPFEMFMTPATGATGNVIIDSISNTYIKGTFSAICIGPTGTVQISNGGFKGNFQ